MKKIFVALLVILLVGGFVNVNAMSESDLLAKLSRSYQVNGKSVKLDDSVLVQVERYLDTYEVSSADADIISEQIDILADYLKTHKVSSYAELSAEGKALVTSAINTVSNKTSIKVTISDNGTVTVYAPGTNKVFAAVDKNGVVIRKTGNSYVLVGIASIITLIGAAVAIKKIAGANA